SATSTLPGIASRANAPRGPSPLVGFGPACPARRVGCPAPGTASARTCPGASSAHAWRSPWLSSWRFWWRSSAKATLLCHLLRQRRRSVTPWPLSW
ncbi:unnamed protein product, partial [Effrenium voratum]